MGVYKTENWDNQHGAYVEHTDIGVRVQVTHLESGVMSVDKRGSSSGKFIFTASHYGDHHICFSVMNGTSWLVKKRTRLFLDLVLGSTSEIDDHSDTHKIDDLSARIQDLIYKARDIIREQDYQRYQETSFREFSHLINSRIVLWTLVQIILLAGMASWQLYNLKNFFMVKKLV